MFTQRDLAFDWLTAKPWNQFYPRRRRTQKTVRNFSKDALTRKKIRLIVTKFFPSQHLRAGNGTMMLSVNILNVGRVCVCV